jgi:hypothetical protein
MFVPQGKVAQRFFQPYTLGRDVGPPHIAAPGARVDPAVGAVPGGRGVYPNRPDTLDAVTHLVKPGVVGVSLDALPLGCGASNGPMLISD